MPKFNPLMFSTESKSLAESYKKFVIAVLAESDRSGEGHDDIAHVMQLFNQIFKHLGDIYDKYTGVNPLSK